MKGVTRQPPIFARWPALLSDREAADYLGVSRSLVREWLAEGRISRVLLPHPSGYGYVKRTLISREDLDSFIVSAKTGAVQGGSPP